MAGSVTIEQVVRAVAALAGATRVRELPGGLTNANYRVDTPRGSLVVRLSAVDAGLLAIDRANEHHNSVAAAEAGIGAPVVDYVPELGVLVLGYLDGRTQSA